MGTQPTINYDTPASVAIGKLNDGDQFIVMKKSRQSDEFEVYSSGDREVTQRTWEQAQRQLQSTLTEA